MQVVDHTREESSLVVNSLSTTHPNNPHLRLQTGVSKNNVNHKKRTPSPLEWCIQRLEVHMHIRTCTTHCRMEGGEYDECDIPGIACLPRRL